ncbi:PDDEXK nuclease domain-containing protein [Pseudobutyrivibrio sp. MD2005]|uniref:PDDEXK nuclease domain-containing protein n=1 Tax=Pseudobutyrivibrio sp. MD2005 TaxID=1410616 RepID=UPI0004835560|nr:PDDEXK nuclease domain-containing protein [Pseudobutyrivibrio sp. MD2005]
MNELIEYNMSDDLQKDLHCIIENAQQSAIATVNTVLVLRNWLLGMRISTENMDGTRAERYGEHIIPELSEELTRKYGKGFDKRSLYRYVQFYQTYPEIVGTVTPQSDSSLKTEIVGTATPQSGEYATIDKNRKILTWSHYERLLQVSDPAVRNWYEKEAIEQSWSVRTLRRNISTQYYDRMLLSSDKSSVETEMKEKTNPYQKKYEFLRNPIIADFLGMEENRDYLESELEKNIIKNLEKFMMELGKGFAFVERQQRIHTEKEDYYIDLVFYNFILKCFVLIDLKIGKISHQDVGQMDMYVRMYDDLRKRPDDNPTLGIVLCSETDEDIARYSVLHGNEQLFASKYRLCLPTEEQLRAEIEAQKEIFYMQHPEMENKTLK